MALAGEEIGDHPPHERAAMAVVFGLQLGERHPQRAHDAVVERTHGIVPYRFGGERKTQVVPAVAFAGAHRRRSEEHTSELQSLMRISYAVFCLKKKNPDARKDRLLPVWQNA